MIEDDILEPLDEKNIVCYIDWKLEFDDVLYNINRILSKRKLNKLSINNKELYGEEAYRYCKDEFHNEDYFLSMIDVNSDGFYIYLIKRSDKDEVIKELELLDYKYKD